MNLFEQRRYKINRCDLIQIFQLDLSKPQSKNDRYQLSSSNTIDNFQFLQELSEPGGNKIDRSELKKPNIIISVYLLNK